MGALRKFMPITAATFIIGWLSISGVPPFSGFWSKDEILLFALADSTALYVIGLITAVLTALYMTRQVIMVFFGEARWTSLANDEEAPEALEGDEPVETHDAHGEFKPHESPPIMWIPLVDPGRDRRVRRDRQPAVAVRHRRGRPRASAGGVAAPRRRGRRGRHQRHVGG